MRRQTFFVLFPLLIFALSSCGVPERWSDGSATGEVDTRYKTVSALLTATVEQEQTQVVPALRSVTPTPTFQPVAFTLSPKPVLAETTTHTPQQTDTVTIAAEQSEKTPTCDLAQAGRPIDVTIPDDTLVRPGENFSKTWRLVNAGSCTWDASYAVVWFSGADIGVSHTQNLPGLIPTGKSVDVTVDMVAPSAPGSYQSNWKLSNSAGALFGIGPAGDAPFWVRIVVIPEDTPTPTEPAPSETPTPVPQVYVSGVIMLLHDTALNLDSGLSDTGSHADLGLSWPETEGAQAQLLPQNGARMAAMGSRLPDQNQCLNADLSDTPLVLDNLEPGLFLCVRTNQGLPGRIMIAAIDSTNRQITVDFTVWAVP